MGISSVVGDVGQVPVGVVAPFAGSVAPAKWLLCDGSAVSRVTYAGLFLVVGTTYGVGDGSTTFNLPDLRGRTIAGRDNMGGSAASRLTSGTSGINGSSLGAAGGDERVQLHTHSFTGSAGTTGNDNAEHTHSYQTVYNTSAMVPAGASYYVYYPTTTSTGGRSSVHQHSFTPSGTNSNFGAGGSQNVQPTIVLNYIVRAV